jgi:cytosine/adenosine deaminase-related metal-dependent hydrolase
MPSSSAGGEAAVDTSPQAGLAVRATQAGPDRLVVRGGFVYTSDPSATVHERASVVIEGGVITAVDPGEGRIPPGATTIDATGMMVLPGFVNPHWHDMHAARLSPAGALRSCSDRHDEPGFLGGGGDMARISQMFDRFCALRPRLTAGEAEAIATFALWSQLRSGTTTVGDMGSLNQPGPMAAAARRLGIRAVLSTWAGDVLCPADGDRPVRTRPADEVLGELGELLHTHGPDRQGLVRARPSVVYATNMSDELGAGIAELARRFDVGFATHLGAQRHERAFVERYFGAAPIARFDTLGLLGARTMAAHCAFVTADEYELLRDRGVHLDHSPAKYGGSGESTLSETGILSQAIRDGLNVSLSTDGAANALGGPIENMRAAWQAHNEMAADQTVVVPTRALAMATASAAHGLGADDVGAIVPGRRADLVLVPIRDWRFALNPRPLEALLALGGSTDVDTVIVDGRVLLRGGRGVDVDEHEVLDEYVAAVMSFSRRVGVADDHLLARAISADARRRGAAPPPAVHRHHGTARDECRTGVR